MRTKRERREKEKVKGRWRRNERDAQQDEREINTEMQERGR